MVKNLPANAEDGGVDPWVGKIPLEEEMAAHSSILARKMQWTEGSRGLHSMGSQSDTTE